MKDIKVTDDNKLEMLNGDFVLIDGVDRIKQHLKTGIKGILPGTWLLNPKAGVDYFGDMAVYTSILKAQIKNAIREVWGVSLLKTFNFTKENQVYFANGTVAIDNEDLNFNEEISWK